MNVTIYNKKDKTTEIIYNVKSITSVILTHFNIIDDEVNTRAFNRKVYDILFVDVK